MTGTEVKLARKKGRASKTSYSAHALVKNRNGLMVDFRVDEANRHAERRNRTGYSVG